MPSRPPLNTRDGIATLAQAAERLGFDGLSVSDHIAPPPATEASYPYAEPGAAGKPAWHDPTNVLESLSLLSFLAALCPRLRLVTGVLILPFRNPVLMAKMLATIDVLSAGRLTVGCGVGWEEREFAALSTPPFAERGRVVDEYIAFFRELWTNEQPEFNGTFARFPRGTFLPKPIQKPAPPIWVGGESAPAMRRAARLGDGWVPVGSDVNPLDTPQLYAGGVAKVRAMARGFGRDPAQLAMAYFALGYNDRQAQTTPSGGRRLFTGSCREIADDINRMEEAGLQHLILSVARPAVQEVVDIYDRFANEVRPHLAALGR